MEKPLFRFRNILNEKHENRKNRQRVRKRDNLEKKQINLCIIAKKEIYI